MRLLFVTLNALETNTSVTKSNIGLLEGLYDLGYEIDIIMPELDNRVKYYDNFYKLDRFKVYRIVANDVGSKIAASNTNAKGLKYKLVSIARKIYYKFKIIDRGTQLLKEAKNIPVFQNEYDIVLSTSDPKSSHFFVKKMKKNGLKYKKWVQHWGDPLSSDITNNSICPIFVKRIIERRILDYADKIIYVSPFTLDYQKKIFSGLSNKRFFVPLACDIKTNLSDCSETEQGELLLSYLGDYNSNTRNILPLYNACKRVEDIRLVIAGNTDLKLDSTSNIDIYPRIPQNKVKEFEDKSDIMVSIGNLKGTQIPGKIYYGASTQKSILVTVDGDMKHEMKEYIESYGRFICCENIEEDIYNILMEFKTKHISKQNNN